MTALNRTLKALCAVWLMSALGCGPPATNLISPPSELGLDPFFTKYLAARDVAVVSGPWVPDAALYEAQRLVVAVQTEGDPRRSSLFGFRIELFADKDGIRSLPGRASSEDLCGLTEYSPSRLSVNADSLLCRTSNCKVGSTLLHEIGHALLGQYINMDIVPLVQGAWEAAMAKGLWSRSYGRHSAEEYWAEATQIWFDAKPGELGDHIHTRSELEAYDPTLSELVAKVLGRGSWRYRCPAP